MTPTDLSSLVKILHTPDAGYTLVVAPADSTAPLTFSRRGVSDLIDLLDNSPALLRNASVADKVVGRAAAAIMILGGVARLHTDVISTRALDLFAGHDIEVTYDTVTDYILSRVGIGWCPLESICRNLSTPAECLGAIRSFLSSRFSK